MVFHDVIDIDFQRCKNKNDDRDDFFLSLFVIGKLFSGGFRMFNRARVFSGGSAGAGIGRS